MKKIISSHGQPAAIVPDHWQLVRSAPVSADTCVSRILPFALWQQMRVAGIPMSIAQTGVWLAPEDDVTAELDALLQLPLLAVDFPSFRDGRGYSVAYLLRSHYGYAGELRAIGEVLRDQLFYLQRCGFDSFDVAADQDIDEALKGLSGISIKYQGAVDDPVPLFRKRAEAATADDGWEP